LAAAAVPSADDPPEFKRWLEALLRPRFGQEGGGLAANDAITSYGRVSGYFVSAREYEELRRPRAFERRVHRIKDLPAQIAAAIQGVKMHPAHERLNALLDERQKHK
jgi:hypothetical protein